MSNNFSLLHENDVMLASFPRSGNTWVMNLLLYMGILVLEGYFHDLQIERAIDIPDTPSEYVPALRKLKTILGDKIAPYRVIKIHERYQSYFHKSIYVVRDGRDVMVSYYFFQNRFNNFKGSFSDFLSISPPPAREWADHVESWLSSKDSNVLFLRYEKLVKNPLEEVRAVLDFLGERRSFSEIKNAISNCSFQKLLTHELMTSPTSTSDPNLRFFRKGSIGDWKNFFRPRDIFKFGQEANWMLLKLGYAKSTHWGL